MAEDFDDIRMRSPFSSVDGNETIVLNQNGTTKGGFLSVMLNWIRDNLTVTPDNIAAPATSYGRNILTIANQAALRNEAAPAIVTESDLLTGTLTQVRSLTPALLTSAIISHSQKTPQAITSATTLSTAHLGKILVCDATGAISLTLPTITGMTRGAFEVINLASSNVTLTPGAGITFIGDTGTIANKVIPQYAQIKAFWLGSNRWSIRNA